MARANILLVSAAALLVGAGPSGAVDSDPAFGAKVRQYLLENPEVILEVMDVLTAREAERAAEAMLAPHLGALFGTEMDLRVGRADAPRVIVEFFDYNCSVCKGNSAVMAAFVADHPDVAIVKKHLPILSPASERAVRYVLAARKVYGAAEYEALHKAIYTANGVLNLARLGRLARDLGLTPDLIEAGMQDDEITAIIDQNREIAIALNVVGTPTLATSKALFVGVLTPQILADLASGA